MTCLSLPKWKVSFPKFNQFQDCLSFRSTQIMLQPSAGRFVHFLDPHYSETCCQVRGRAQAYRLPRPKTPSVPPYVRRRRWFKDRESEFRLCFCLDLRFLILGSDHTIITSFLSSYVPNTRLQSGIMILLAISRYPRFREHPESARKWQKSSKTHIWSCHIMS